MKIGSYIFLFFLLFQQYQPTFAQTFECDNNFYLSLADGETEISDLYYMDIFDLSNNTTFELFDDTYGIPLNCIGYNVDDKLIYGLNPENYHLIRINALGEVEDLGIPPNLNTTDYVYYAGCFSPQGNRLVVIGRDKETGLDQEFFSIRFDVPNFQAGFLSLFSEDGTRLEDIAYDPVYGDLYGYDGLHKRIVTVDLGTGAVVTYQASTLPTVSSMGSLFFDETGVLYGYGSQGSEENTLFKIDKFERTIADTYTGPSAAISDGCSCPYRIQFNKKPSSHQVLPCSEFTVIYETLNTAGSSYTQVTLLDSFPTGFTITEIVKPPSFGNIESGVGTNKLHISGMDLLLGLDSVIIKVEAETEAEPLHTHHAIMEGFPLALGVNVFSDDRSDTETVEPTTIEVITEDLLLVDEVAYVCEDASIQLATVDVDVNYLWSDGSTTSSIEASESGFYWVELSNDCVTYRDSIFVELVETPLSVELGENQTINIGQMIELSFETNAATPIQISWTMENNLFLSCTDCDSPSLSPTASSLVNVYIQDEYGCMAEDQIMIEVIDEINIFAPNIFTPNDDGMNDLFYLQGAIDFNLLDLTIFNRWGGVVHSVKEGNINVQSHGWNGMFKGDIAPEGIYLWIATIQLPNGDSRQLTGDLSLVR